MYDQMLDGFRKATESTVQMQQEMVRLWTRQVALPAGLPFGVADPTAAFRGIADRARALQKQGTEALTRLLEKHRETLDAQYKAGIQTIEKALRVGEARDAEELRKLVEELWRHSFETLRTVGEAQMGELRAAIQEFSEAASKGMAATTA